MLFYALYSKSQKCYNTPFLAHGDKDAVAIIYKTVVAQQDPALIMCLDDLKLVRVGRFVASHESPIENLDYCGDVLDNLHETLPLPPMIKAQVDKLYVKKEVSNE